MELKEIITTAHTILELEDYKGFRVSIKMILGLHLEEKNKVYQSYFWTYSREEIKKSASWESQDMSPKEVISKVLEAIDGWCNLQLADD